ncbi:MAG: hydroxymethylglutaryl-CoA reductase [Candidatus Aenigmarchaeota archaeon]|nr:hydroxymethylglutaryl-CoA reductase [Candidatus Aenigmarchaeota archaeon]
MGKDEELVEKLMKGKIKLREVENYTKDSNEATKIRRIFLEKKYKVKLENIGKTTIDFNDALNRNIENPVGATQVPLGFAGELKVNGDYAKGFYPILLATTEGRLVAGTARGIKIFNMAGGINTVILKEGMARDVLVRTKSARDSYKLIRWAQSEEAFKFFSDEFLKSNIFLKLKEVKAYTAGRYVHIRFKSGSGAAMGMNMITIASKSAVDAMIPKIKKELGLDVTLISESGNMCTDKKAAYIDVLEGRGVSVIADAVIPRKIIKEEFRVEPERIVELNKAKCLQGSALAGSHGFNAHIGNVLAAMYIAHGQDPAQITEGTQAITDAAVVDGDLYVSCYIPALEVGTYGGGTKRETQQEALKLLGLYGEGDETGKTKFAFAEVVAAACLASEINLHAIEAAGELSKTHGSLKRG